MDETERGNENGGARPDDGQLDGVQQRHGGVLLSRFLLQRILEKREKSKMGYYPRKKRLLLSPIGRKRQKGKSGAVKTLIAFFYKL